jgi:hypothetical protein
MAHENIRRVAGRDAGDWDYNGLLVVAFYGFIEVEQEHVLWLQRTFEPIHDRVLVA